MYIYIEYIYDAHVYVIYIYIYTPCSRSIRVTQFWVSRTTTPKPKSQNMLPKYPVSRSTRKKHKHKLSSRSTRKD